MIYLDNSATTRPFDQVIQKMADTMREAYFNPSAAYKKGLEAERVIQALSERLCRATGAYSATLTSGGTEANNLALQGIVGRMREKRPIAISAVEHPSVTETAGFLKGDYPLIILPVDRTGVVQMEAVEEALLQRPALISVMQVNNETGAIQPVEEIGRRIRLISPETVFHVDGVQGFGRIPFSMKTAGADLYTVSAHKIHGPKGMGALLQGRDVRLRPCIHGGGQQGGIRSGTENMPGIVGFLAAMEDFEEHLMFWQEEGRENKLYLSNQLEEAGALLNGPLPERGAPHILNVSFPGIKGEVLLHALEAREVLVSTGSACASHGTKPSPTLTGMGLPKNRIESAVRVSMGLMNGRWELTQAAQIILEEVEALRPFIRR